VLSLGALRDAEVNQPKLASIAGQYRKPRNIASDFATGLADDYDAGMDTLRDRLTRTIRGNNKAGPVRTNSG
jgi:hypothetical protein